MKQRVQRRGKGLTTGIEHEEGEWIKKTEQGKPG